MKIVDAQDRRYEVKVLDSVSEQLPVDVNQTDYEFLLDVEIPGFSVVRKSTQEVGSFVRTLHVGTIKSMGRFSWVILSIQTLFSSVGIGGFIYSDQFLQISSLLPSGNIYGIGEHQDSLRHSMDWQTMALFAHDEIPSKGKNLYGSHPFYLMVNFIPSHTDPPVWF